MLNCLWLVCTLLALIGCGYAIFAGLLATRLGAEAPPTAGNADPISFLKPLYGAEKELSANLQSFLRQDYPAELQLVCGVQNPEDPAVNVVTALQAADPDGDIVLVRSPKSRDGNPKIANVVGMVPSAKHDILVLSDSDMNVDPDYAARIFAALQAPGVGLVTCLYRGRAVGDFWSRMAAAAVDHHFLPSALAGLALGLAKPCFGSTIALRRRTLDSIGGFEAFSRDLADDYAIGDAVRRLGLKVAIPPFTIGHTFAERTFSEVATHELRWARTIKLVDPWGYAGSVVTHPLPFALCGLFASGFNATGFAILTLTLACRLFVPLQVERLAGGGKSTAWLSPLRDVMSFGIFVASYLPGPVQWRGRSYRVASDGSMTRS